MAREDFDVAAIVKIVDAEGASAAGLDGEIAARDAEIVFARGSHVKRSRTLAKNQACGACPIVER